MRLQFDWRRPSGYFTQVFFFSVFFSTKLTNGTKQSIIKFEFHHHRFRAIEFAAKTCDLFALPPVSNYGATLKVTQNNYRTSNHRATVGASVIKSHVIIRMVSIKRIVSQLQSTQNHLLLNALRCILMYLCKIAKVWLTTTVAVCCVRQIKSIKSERLPTSAFVWIITKFFFV